MNLTGSSKEDSHNTAEEMRTIPVKGQKPMLPPKRPMANLSKKTLTAMNAKTMSSTDSIIWCRR